MVGSKRRSSRQVAKRSIYAEPETDDDDFEFEHQRLHQGDDDYEAESISQPPPPKRQRKVPPRKPHTRSADRKPQQSLKSTFKIGKPRKANSKSHRSHEHKELVGSFRGPSDNKIPDWTSLPVDILREVFIFASLSTYDGYERPDAAQNASWLFRCARICRAFAQPALEAYYQAPILLGPSHMHDFLGLLQTPKETRYMDYNVKVRRLTISITNINTASTGRQAFYLPSLMPHVPQLQHLEINHVDHFPPFRAVKRGKWTFNPQLLFQAMDDSNIRLKSWRWARNMVSRDVSDLYGMMTDAHSRKMFAGLERLVVCQFNVSDSAEPVDDQDADGNTQSQPGLASAIAKLPCLKDLSFNTCDVIFDQFLTRLPTTLHRLELSNCLEITSDLMRAFFSTSASELQELVLNHNAALSLSFLQALKTACPRLQVLKIDLQCYSEKLLTDDSEPLYDELLGPDEVPTWPPTLRHLEILHAQKWQSAGAENLFRSLVDSASELPDLRYLAIHAHINIPWRERVGFRERWIKRLRGVYLRKADEPSKNLGSLKQFRRSKDLYGKTIRTPRSRKDELSLEFSDDSQDDAPLAGRQLSHVRVSPHKPSDKTQYFSETDITEAPQTRQPRRSKRVAETQASQDSTPPESDPEDESGEDNEIEQPKQFIQGLCNVVDIRIDNQRPREEQYTEAHFLDSERSGDEDWHEGVDEDDQGGYAW